MTTAYGTATSTTDFTVTLVPPPPTVSVFAPISGRVGTVVTVTGAGFSGASAVTFGGVPAPVFTVVSDVRLTATVPLGAVTGPIAVTTVNGTGASTASFAVTVIPPRVKPAIAKLSPTTGKRGALVTITGKGFGSRRGTSIVTFGSRKCTKYVAWSATRIQCRVPAEATLGKVKVRVTTSVGRSSPKRFVVKR